jgi:hypothetical protein
MELVKVTDQDGNVLEVVKPSDDWPVLLLRVTDENDIPVGLFLDADAAVAVRCALDSFIENSGR